MVINNPNNWHWVDKNCLPWSIEYFKSHLEGLKVEKQNQFICINEVSSVEGDVDVSQRKGKVISLFDVRIVLIFSGYSDKDTSINGSIIIPELTYDSELDDLQFEITIYNETGVHDEFRTFIKKELFPKLREKLMKFGVDLIETNSKDIQLSQDKVTSTFTKSNQAASTTTTTTTPKKEEPVAKPTPSPVVEPTKQLSPVEKGLVVDKIDSHKKVVYADNSTIVPKYNTTTLHLEPAFNTTAEEIYKTLLDESRISAWTRSFPVIDNPVKEGSAFTLFGGGIQGKILQLVPNERIVELWRISNWKEGHFAQLDMRLIQSSDETKMVVKFTGIPIGEEETVRNSFEERYIRAIKITFGFGAVL